MKKIYKLTSKPRNHNTHIGVYVTVVSVGDALGRGATGDLMLSCLTGRFQCKCDLILFITGADSAWQHLQVAFLALLVL